MKIISLYSIKGGVGKTAAAVNLAYLSAQENNQTLLCDLDPQGASSFYFKIRPSKKFSAKKLIKKEGSIEKNIKGSDYENLDILPSDISFRKLDLLLDHQNNSLKKLKQLLKTLKDEYTYIFLDCPPNITLQSENIFYASDIILLPIIPSSLSINSYETLIDFFNNEKLKSKKIYPFFSLVDRRKKMHKEIVESYKENKNFILQTEIPYASAVEKMGYHKMPIFEFEKHSKAAGCFKKLWVEIKDKILS